MGTSLETDTNDILWITNLLNKCPIYTIDKEVDIQTLSNDENFKSILKYAVKENIDRIQIYLSINNLHFKSSFKPEIYEDIYYESFTTS